MSTTSRTIRFPEQVSRRGAALAKRTGKSFNELVVESVEERIRREEDQEWIKDLDWLADHPELTDVEYGIPAFNEVLNAQAE